MARALWRSRWGVLRLVVAAVLLWTFAADTGARLARLRLAALPDFDYAAEVGALRAKGRYGEAVMVADAGLRALDGSARERVERERAATIAEQASWLRRAKDLGLGAVSGHGDSLESLIGAVAADFFIVGDVRDLVIEGGKEMLDGEGDEAVLLLSLVGVVTTLAPEVDWVPSLFKAAKRAGTLTHGMQEHLVKAIRGKRGAELAEVFGETERIARRASPGGAMRLLVHAEDPADLKRLAAFVEREADGAFALRVTGPEGWKLVRDAGEGGEKLVVKAARKGPAGAAFLRTRAARALLRPHPLVGLLKGLKKGTLADAAARLIERIDPGAWWIVPALAAWALVEAGFIARRVALAARAGEARRDTGTLRRAA